MGRENLFFFFFHFPLSVKKNLSPTLSSDHFQNHGSRFRSPTPPHNKNPPPSFPSPLPRHHHTSSTPSAASPTPTAGARRKIGVAIDLSSESAFAVRWAVYHYIRPGDAVVLLHVSPTSVLYGADWGPLPLSTTGQQSQEDFDAFTSSKVAELAKPLKESGFPYKVHIVKDHDMRERLCLEIERLGVSAVIMGSRGFGAEKKKGSDDDDDDEGRLGSVSDYCVHHSVCPVVVVRFPHGPGPGPVVTVKTGDDDEDVATHHEHIKDE